MDLPQFTYHPKAYALGLFKKSKKTCQCCRQVRGLIYDKTPYAVKTLDAICPWCIADGSASKKFEATFAQAIEPPEGNFNNPLKIDATIVDEVMRKTPGYVSWQGEYWLTHCEDVCVFYGDLEQNELLSLPEKTLALFKTEHAYLFSEQNWGSIEAFNEIYFPAGDIALYKFTCRHCGLIRLHCDMS